MLFLKRIMSAYRKVNSIAFKIEDDGVDSETGLIYFWVKIEGKCSPLFKRDPIDLLRDSRGKNHFSAEDHDLIIEAMLENQKIILENKYLKKHRLIKHQFSEQLAQPLIVYSDLNNKIHIKPAKEIYSKIENLKNFNSEDSACIGNIVGSHETEQEFKLRTRNNKTNIIKFDTSLGAGL